MIPPVMNRRLTLEDAYRVPDGAGGFTTAWQAVGQLWADVRPGRGRGRARDALTLTQVPLEIIVRAAPTESEGRPMAGQRFRDGTRIFNITAVTEKDRHGRFLSCRATEETTV